MTKQEQLHALLDNGFYLFPVRPNQKEPMQGFKWKLMSSNSVATVDEWLERFPEHNWAVDCGKSGLLVVDVDVKGGKDGTKTLQDLQEEHGDLPTTATQRTPNNGIHYIFRGKGSTSAGTLGEGIDIRSTGGYVLISPSFIDGKAYSFDPCSVVGRAPNWLESRDSKEAPILPTTDIEMDKEENVERGISFLQRTAGAVEGQGGDFYTFGIACKLRDLGISASKSMELMVEHWNEKCEPPWDPPDLYRKIWNAHTYAQNESPGTDDLANHFPDDLPSEVSKDDSPFDPEDLPRPIGSFDGSPPDREWVIDEWLPANELTLFTGEGGLGKSLVALQLAAAVAHGVPLFGRKTSKRPVLMVACEDNYDELHRRWDSIRKGMEYQFLDEGSDPVFLLWSRTGNDSIIAYVEGYKMVTGPFFQVLDHVLLELGLGALIILDTLSDIFGGNENDRSSVNTFVKTILGGLANKYMSTIMTIGHPPKNASEYSGSTAWSNAHRNRLWLSKVERSGEDTKIRELKHTKSNYSEAGNSIFIRWSKGKYEQIDDDDFHIPSEEDNLEIIFNVVAEYAIKHMYIGTRRNSPHPIHAVDITKAEGTPMGDEEKVALCKKLVMTGFLEELTGQENKNKLGLHIKKVFSKEK